MNKLLEKTNIIDSKVNNYMESIKYNFKSNIKIDTSIVQYGDKEYINYELASERVIYHKAKILFSNIGEKVFYNNLEKIFVSNNDIKESVDKTIKNVEQKKYLNENLAVFSKLDKIIEKASIISISKNDIKGRKKYFNYKYYVSNVIIDGKKYVVEFDTRIQNSTGKDERHFRLERIYPISKEASATVSEKNSGGRFVTETSLYKHNNTNNLTSQIIPNENQK